MNLTNESPIQFEVGGERSTEVEVRAQAPASRNLSRHDPPISIFETKTNLEPTNPGKECLPRGPRTPGLQIHNFHLALPYGDRWSLIVLRNTGQFTLLEIHNGAVEVRVSAPEAQVIKDYLDANWPVGTKAKWFVVPPFKPVQSEVGKV